MPAVIYLGQKNVEAKGYHAPPPKEEIMQNAHLPFSQTQSVNQSIKQSISKQEKQSSIKDRGQTDCFTALPRL